MIAPLWGNSTRGVIYYRTSEDTATLEQVAEMVYHENDELTHFQPIQAIIVTWHQVQLSGTADDIRVSYKVYVFRLGYSIHCC